MAGDRDGREESQDATSREPCTTPLLQQQQKVLRKEALSNSCTEQDPPYTLPLLLQDMKPKEHCMRHPLQDIQSLEPCTIPLLANLDLSLTTPMGTPIPGRAIAIHGTCTPLSGTSTPILDCKTVSIDSMSLVLPGPQCHCDSKSQLSMLSDTNSALLPICRICHLPEDGGDILISPCRCAGTLQFIHNTCLMKWLEITTKKSRKPPKCELCHYQYHRHKKFKMNHWRFPRVSRQDKVLHIIFLINLVMMIGCAIATVMCFLSDKEHISNLPRNKVELSTEEIITLSCGVLFFVSFFIAMSVQIKARHTVYQLFVKFITQNMEWEIDEYDKSKDSLYMVKGSPAYV
ncbi:hypothetical protein LSH36_667g00021 [Paralvinella palmiformis]|uniref:RING-CH-type domain-containing protein n=1 Tax=Paralvinella palmiformis TaxID=53620 RepID=A0AAD9J311_9ANNE|nr:hypothetical protein LSH36_667g00021 [Paralvinella palmiformis]